MKLSRGLPWPEIPFKHDGGDCIGREISRADRFESSAVPRDQSFDRLRGIEKSRRLLSETIGLMKPGVLQALYAAANDERRIISIVSRKLLYDRFACVISSAHRPRKFAALLQPICASVCGDPFTLQRPDQFR
jgi:hypothetical protein